MIPNRPWRLPAAFLFNSVLVIAASAARAQAPAWSQGVPYTYDAAGNVVSIGNDVQTYDRMGRLATSETNGVRTGFTYDAFGNRVTCLRSTGADCQYGLDIDNGTNQIVDATYDSAGNVIAFDGHAFSHDVLNMQTSDVGAGVERNYVYTPTDERIAVYTPVTGSWQWTLRDPSNRILREFASEDGPAGHGTDSWRWAKDYVWRDAQLLATRQPEPGSTSVSTYYYHLDHLGSPRVITNQSNAVVGGHSYHAFGPETSDGLNEPSLTSLKYTGHERDGEFDSMHARYYTAKLGRFLSPDPVLGNLLQPGSWNRYQYVLNNPLNLVDPTGRYEIRQIQGGAGSFTCINDICSADITVSARDPLHDLFVWMLMRWLASPMNTPHPISGMTLSEHLRASELGITEFVDGVIPFLDVDENDYGSNVEGLEYSELIGEYTRDIEIALAAGGATMETRGGAEAGNWITNNVFRWGKGAWKNSGGPKWHFHLGPGKGVMRHHMPYQFQTWRHHAPQVVMRWLRNLR
ncbi:MAG TPA: RHS repeat-associated core domain-containing protein [Thermoanaerobaculia bacterium]|nr:RHS repeat-associated core domain-containing protein [Thermoanaerobaculia bacterium]